MKDIDYIKSLLPAALAVAGAALGGWDLTLKFLIWCMAADYAMGLMAAALGRSPKTAGGGLSSRVSFLGLCRKVTVILLVVLAARADAALGTQYIRGAVVAFFIGSEGLSIAENAGLLGVPLPAPLTRMFEALRNRGESEEKESENLS